MRRSISHHDEPAVTTTKPDRAMTARAARVARSGGALHMLRRHVYVRCHPCRELRRSGGRKRIDCSRLSAFAAAIGATGEVAVCPVSAPIVRMLPFPQSSRPAHVHSAGLASVHVSNASSAGQSDCPIRSARTRPSAAPGDARAGSRSRPPPFAGAAGSTSSARWRDRPLEV